MLFVLLKCFLLLLEIVPMSPGWISDRIFKKKKKFIASSYSGTMYDGTMYVEAENFFFFFRFFFKSDFIDLEDDLLIFLF